MRADPYDAVRIKQYREVFFGTTEGMSVLYDILNDLGHFATSQLQGATPEIQMALEHQAKVILDKLGIFRGNNIDGYLSALKAVHPRVYEIPDEQEE